MQTTLCRTMQTARITTSLRPPHFDDKPGRALGIVDGLLSVTQQEWAVGPGVKRSQHVKVTQ